MDFSSGNNTRMSRSHRLEAMTTPLVTRPLLQMQNMPVVDPSIPVGRYRHRLEEYLQPATFRGTIRYRGQIQISDTVKNVIGVFPYEGPESGIRQAIQDDINIKYANVNHEPLWDDMIIERSAEGGIQPLLQQRNPMLHSKPISIVNLYTNIIDVKTNQGNCVPDTLSKKFPKIAKLKKNNPIFALKEANTEEVMEFCKKFNIRAIAYNIDKQVIAENIPLTDDKKYSALAYIYYGNHMYLLENKYLIEKPRTTKHVRETLHNLQDHFKSLLTNILPGNIRSSGGYITSFDHEDTTYFCNDDYDKIQLFGRQFMFSDKTPFYATYTTFMGNLEKLYTSQFANSFLPIKHTKPAFYYNVARKNLEIDTIDKNKAYSYILKNLKYLLSTDIRTYECSKTDQYDDEIALYVARPKVPNVLMPKQDIYSGEHIKYCQNKFEFTILEKLKCKSNANHFTFLIQDLYDKLDPNDAKQIVVSAIGLFQSEHKINTRWNVVTKTDRNPSNFSFPYEDFYLEESKTDSVSNIYNRKPIAIQIKDRMNKLLFEKMEELNLTNEDIVQVNTDSISYYKKPISLSLNKDDFNGWKSGTYTEKRGSVYDNSAPFETFFQTIPNNNTIITGPAGNGKSYYIQHMDLTDSVILSSKHSAIRQHREKGFNAHVIQKFCGVSENMKTTFPKENHIIVEECGILTRQHWDFLFKCVLLNKKLTILGDFNQLLPVDEIYTFNRPAFINMIFGTQTEMNKNWRNNFTLDYYKQLQTGSKEFLIQEIQKYSTKTPEDADVIIAYRNDVVAKYNDYMLTHNKKYITSPDVPVMCITNDLRDKICPNGQEGMYNNFLFRSQEIDQELLTNPKYFKVAYARTLYNMQGDECHSYYMAPEDIHWFANSRLAYTLISRLKHK